jgi:hypothetical protein
MNQYFNSLSDLLRTRVLQLQNLERALTCGGDVLVNEDQARGVSSSCQTWFSFVKDDIGCLLLSSTRRTTQICLCIPLEIRLMAPSGGSRRSTAIVIARCNLHIFFVLWWTGTLVPLHIAVRMTFSVATAPALKKHVATRIIIYSTIYKIVKEEQWIFIHLIKHFGFSMDIEHWIVKFMISAWISTCSFLNDWHWLTKWFCQATLTPYLLDKRFAIFGLVSRVSAVQVIIGRYAQPVNQEECEVCLLHRLSQAVSQADMVWHVFTQVTPMGELAMWSMFLHRLSQADMAWSMFSLKTEPGCLVFRWHVFT